MASVALTLASTVPLAVQPSAPSGQMNNIVYRIANPAPGYETHAFGFASSASFEVLSPPIRSRYSEVVWRTLAPVPLPPDIIAQYNSSVMAVTGWEVDTVRVTNGTITESVPAYQSYNHHYTAQLRGAASRLPAWAVGVPNLRYALPAETLPAAQGRPQPTVQSFNEHNGNEARQSYHGLPTGYVQPVESPVEFVFNPMQINTLNPDGSGTRGGPLPRASAAPAGASYSGILECPCSSRRNIDVAAGTIDGSPFNPRCATDPQVSDLLINKNPTCDIATYVGGMECCKDGMALLDAEQDIPPHVDEVYFRWRFYHERFDAAKHTSLIHLEWAVNGCDSGGPSGNPHNCAHIEFDVPKAPAGTPPQQAVATVTSHFQVKDMLSPNGCSVRTDPYCADATVAAARGGGVALVMAGGHCHSPACLSLELFNDETGELLCRISPRMGTGDKPYDESGYIWLPPCQWGHESRLRPPPVLPLDLRLRAVKRANASAYHYGVMGIFQMRGTYLPEF